MREICERLVDAYAALDPAAGARDMGVGLNTDALRDYSPDGTARLAQFMDRAREELAAAVPADAAERLGRSYVMDWAGSYAALLHRCGPAGLVSALTGPPASVRMGFDLAAPAGPDDRRALARRMSRVPRAMAEYRSSLQKGLDEGSVAPLRCAEAVADQCERWSGGGPGGWFGAYAAHHGALDGGGDMAGPAAAADAAYGQLAEWLRREYLPRASQADGVGEEAYRLWARHCLGAQVDLDEAYRWGWEELERLEGERAAECARLGPGLSFPEARDMLEADPARRVDGVEAWRDWLQELTDRTIGELHGKAFAISEPLRTCAVSIPPEGSAAAAYYTPPSEDLSQPGRIWFPTLGAQSFPTWDAVTTVFHEAVPGHHLQVGLTRSLPLTRMHKLSFSPGHGEGWALYAERLMDELGYFERPDYRLGFLSMQLMRAARVVIDIGLHTGRTIPAGRPRAGERWDFDVAVDALEAASGLSSEYCRSEVARYMSWPSQATCYKLGERAWLAGREEARRHQGAAFDLAAWHRDALALGPLGLDLLGEELSALAREGRGDRPGP